MAKSKGILEFTYYFMVDIRTKEIINRNKISGLTDEEIELFLIGSDKVSLDSLHLGELHYRKKDDEAKFIDEGRAVRVLRYSLIKP